MLHLVHEDGTVALGAHLHTTPMHIHTITCLGNSRFQHKRSTSWTRSMQATLNDGACLTLRSSQLQNKFVCIPVRAQRHERGRTKIPTSA